MPTVRQLFALLREDVEKDAIEETRKEWCDDCETEMIKLQNALKELEYSEHHKQEYTYRKNKPNKGFSLGSYKYKR